ncbi:proton-conducting transporter membrane subunit [Geminisphaera colitermitum]|uniref:proton-conducting transporter transmembrane domain-containing protein n=1 Tax=Geminisphaera colitermitum TaxID=1148786 RepID=UPI0005BC177A|nr:proton-conducting transporter membrane subunit [Geminisphaera colitermitum]
MIPNVLLSLAALCLVATLIPARWLSRENWLALVLGACVAGLAASVCVLAGGGGNALDATNTEGWVWRGGFAIAGETPLLRLDGISALFLALLCVVGGAGAVYGLEYWSDEHYPASARRGRGWWSMMILCMGLVLLNGNGLHFLIAWELFAVSSYFLITLDRRREETRAAGWLYLAASHAGTLCLFAFFATLAARTGSWELGPALREQLAAANSATGGTGVLFWLMLVAFGIKAGLFPLHVWLPTAHANAPSHVSALMSGVAIKMGIYGLIRFTGWLPVPAAAGWVVIGIGATSALLGIAFAFAQTDLKRLLAYCSVENVGVMAIGIGGALIGAASEDAAWGRLLLAGALLHVWNHGLFKALLFFGAGAVLHATGTREMSRLGGLWQRMPWTAAAFALGAAAVSALPPLNGFVSEWLIYLGLFDAATSQGAVMWAAMPAVVMLAMSGALALASFVKAGATVFLGAPRTAAAAHAHECGPLMRGAMWTMAGLCVALGLGPVLVWPAVMRAVNAWGHAAAIAQSLPSPPPPPPLAPPLGTLALVHVLVAGLFAGAGVWLWRRVKTGRGTADSTATANAAHAATPRRGPTWDCGYAQPTARMQYTGGSFAGIVAEWFGWIFRSEKRLRRPHGVFPAEASLMERVPETVLERVIGPAARGVMRVNAAVRRLQHGRLQFYIAYLACGLAVLGVIVWWS